ncbi:MAG: ABC transporter ATP-binding protein/permease [Oscillospiraceae bacterium]|nr:ABC transporter ATP-binding protein/permease [Oscillospiraceae bacterium]MBQ8881029.1 ABC transporter ATP-binding protein/permease [Oscillospiraceae bacterium]
MLQLKNIVKNYAAGENIVRALRGISLQFRPHEFVSILGPSGCGKTTMLNIIGGLDKYTSGDLVIDGRSTKDYKDRDWDAYRNHSIGFVFQSYNLIPHQSVLQNVELALTLSGVSKKERRQRARQALEQVGLGDQLRKKPSQMSGGQMQRVAIARALVNNPEIILADEPTGALDTETSVQVMEILKEVAKDRLVIMVTHNPDLANTYSTRIIRMLDGEITSDSAPLTGEERKDCMEEEQRAIFGKKQKAVRKPSMSWATSFGLSLKNLFTKKGRTALTSFAGSIGIIGIALIYAVSNGMTAYINAVQEDTLSSYPITLEATTVDIGTLMETFMGVGSGDENAHEKDAVYSQSVMAEMINALNNMDSTENDLKAFKAYLEQEMQKTGDENKLSQALTGIQYTYNMDLLVYTRDPDGNIIYSDTQELLTKALRENMGMDMSSMISMGESMSGGMASASMPGMQMKLWCEILSGKDGKPINPVLEDQYDVVYGSWPNSYDEIVLVLDKNNELDDLTLYALGLESHDKISETFDIILSGGEIDTTQRKWSYEEICSKEYRVVLNSDCYHLDPVTGLYVDQRETEAGMQILYNDALKLKITGIIRPSEKASSTMLTGAIGYTKALTEYVAQKNVESLALKAQKEHTGTDIFTGLPFKENASLTVADKEAAFRAYIAELTPAEQAEAYVKILGIPSAEELNAEVEKQLAAATQEQMVQTIVTAYSQQSGLDAKEIEASIKNMPEDELKNVYRQMLAMGVKQKAALMAKQKTAKLTVAQKAGALQADLPKYTPEQCAAYYEEILEFSDSTYEQNLRKLSDVDLDDPATVNLYASSFENKDVVEEVIAEYNASVEELKQIHYTDYVGIMMSSITTIINAITYVLIAFVAISLVVSSIMIGVITLISVQERTKEIGILRAIGASKRNVSGMFNAETMIIGFTSGVLGVAVTYLLCALVNVILYALTGIANLKAILPWNVAVVLVLVSVALTLFSGIIPSRSAAKKDPVVALRTE